MELTEELKREIEKDINLCLKHTRKDGSMSLYNSLVAKYVVVDPHFQIGLSTNGKITPLGEEFDYRPELNAIANKLKMWLILDSGSTEEQNHVKAKVEELIKWGETIGEEEFHTASDGFPFSYVSGPQYDRWMADINVLNERYLKSHSAYASIHTFYTMRSKSPSAYEKMLAQLRAVNADNEFWMSHENNEQNGSSEEDSDTTENKRVFIVHGHDEGAKQAVARFLEQLDFEAIILHEQADGGRTIIEKIEHYSDVVFAIVVYTPCDVGRAKEESECKARARQNVVFEHGYLIGKLGRNRVCALVKEGIETPGDISGVIYKPMDSAGAWKAEILKEMKSSGIDVNANKLI